MINRSTNVIIIFIFFFFRVTRCTANKRETASISRSGRCLRKAIVVHSNSPWEKNVRTFLLDRGDCTQRSFRVYGVRIRYTNTNVEKRIEISYDRPSIDEIIHRIVYIGWVVGDTVSRWIGRLLSISIRRRIYLINLNLPTQISCSIDHQALQCFHRSPYTIPTRVSMDPRKLANTVSKKESRRIRITISFRSFRVVR